MLNTLSRLCVKIGDLGKDSLLKPPSFSGPCHTPSQPVSLTVTDVDDRISSQLAELYMEISLKLESMPTVCRSAFLPAETPLQ